MQTENINQLNQKITTTVQVYLNEADLASYNKAYLFLQNLYRTTKRPTGESFLNHSLEVIKLLLPFRPDLITLQAALLHNVLLNTVLSPETLEKEFSRPVREIVEEITQLSRIRGSLRKGERASMRDFILAVAKNPRVILIKLADYLHNLRVITEMNISEIRERTAQEALQIYAPVAARLGIYSLKEELEDASFKILFPKEYQQITAGIKKYQSAQTKFLSYAQEQLQRVLREAGLEVRQITGRIKRPYSIFNKMKRKEIDRLEEVYDLAGLRVIVPSREDCYLALGVIHAHFTSLEGHFRDYIVFSKPNLYQSLHTTVIGLGTKSAGQTKVEIQIRTPEMHARAEYGAAAHFVYKEGQDTRSGVEKMMWLKGILQTREDDDEDNAFKKEIFQERVFVFDEQGSIQELPKGATALDYVYVLYGEEGHHCQTVKVNNKVVPFGYVLKNGDLVTFVKKMHQSPSPFWLASVNTKEAKDAIQIWLSSQKKLVTPERETLNQGLSKRKDVAINSLKDSVEPIVTQDLSSNLLTKKETQVLVAGEKNISYELAGCCQPKNPTPLIAYVDRYGKVLVHRSDCGVVHKISTLRLMEAQWTTEGLELKAKRVRLSLKFKNQAKTLKAILDLLTNREIKVENLVARKAETEKDLTQFNFDLKMGPRQDLGQLLAQLRKMRLVKQVEGEWEKGSE
ncbi:hypothetical protein COT40_00830 [Candidatus Peregrinibacteria bacterium CG08_land_8_20_14_0_20_41_10]|nr:MAG: hypothetical protein COT40_00830 [Candidatus Peregrinibacteria bacterium CG08_land_8_20_14_0_20_41_10]